MWNYLASEKLKYRHTFTRQLIWIAPAVVILLNVLSPVWYQQNSFNWWYVVLYPGFLTFLCILVNQKDGGKLKYFAVYPLPVNLEKLWYAKVAVCMAYALMANVFLMVCNVLGGLLLSRIYGIPMTVPVLRALAGTICIVLASVWNIPLCLWLSNKIGGFATLIVHVGLGFLLGVSGAGSHFWILCPYSWAARLMVPILGILPNGEPANAMDLPVSPVLVGAALILSLVLLSVLSMATAKSFARQEVR